MKVVRVCNLMIESQRNLLIREEFGGMLGTKCSKLIPELCRFLMTCFDPKTCELDFRHRGRIHVTDVAIHKVMGVPMGSIPVPYHVDINATTIILEMFSISNGVHPTITYVEKELGPAYPADDAYLRKFILYVMSSVFAPTTCKKVSPKCYPSLINTTTIKEMNWARFIIDTLIQTANAKGIKYWFKACMPFLMILYVDSLETDVVDVLEDGTQSYVWTNKMTRLVVDLDTNTDGSFGMLPLKACYINKPYIFSIEPSVIDLFILRHAPGNPDEVLANYRADVTNMCTIFEEGLASFIWSLALTEPKYNKCLGDEEIV